jgi:hypothetical protein
MLNRSSTFQVTCSNLSSSSGPSWTADNSSERHMLLSVATSGRRLPVTPGHHAPCTAWHAKFATAHHRAWQAADLPSNHTTAVELRPRLNLELKCKLLLCTAAAARQMTQGLNSSTATGTAGGTAEIKPPKVPTVPGRANLPAASLVRPAPSLPETVSQDP